MQSIETPQYEEAEAMAENAAYLAEKVVGHRIVSAEKGSLTVKSEWSSYSREESGLVLTLDDGTKVLLADSSDCCAYTELEAFLLHPDRVDHIITGVGTSEDYTKWHIFADMEDVLKLTVGWSPGNYPYYGYGFEISVVPAAE